MNPLIQLRKMTPIFLVTLIRCSLIFLVPVEAYAISTQWVMDPISGDWNTAANWDNGVPNGTADIATFARSNTTDVSISENTKVNGIVFTAAATNPRYTITANPGLKLTISGTGITNNADTIQEFVTAGGGVNIGTGGHVEFINNATAGSGAIRAVFTNNPGEAINAVGGLTSFHNSSTAANCLFLNDGATVSVGAGGMTAFTDSSHAANGFFINTGGTVKGAKGGSTIFDLNSHADSAFLLAEGGTNGGQGGTILFQGNSHGGGQSNPGPQVEVFGNGTLDLSNHAPGTVTIGSIEGDGMVVFGPKVFELDIGGNNMDTTFSGVIAGSGSGADLHKVGTGRLTLSGDANVGGDVDVDHGVLQVDGSLHSGNTFVKEGATLAGSGTVTNPTLEVHGGGTVSPGSTGQAGGLTVKGNYVQSGSATLIIQIKSAAEFSTLVVQDFASLDGTLDPVLLNGFNVNVGDTFDFLFYHDHVGEFSKIEGDIWSITYEDRMAVLTLERLPSVPDQGSTFLLLTLGLLGLVSFRRQSLRGQTKASGTLLLGNHR